MAEERREIRFRFQQQRPRRRPSSAISAEPAYRAPLPRITRLMALAILWDPHLRDSVDLDAHALAQVGRVSRTRITQIANLLHLAPDIQERLLRLSPLAQGREPITEKSLRRLAAEYDWRRQREHFAALLDRRIGRQEENK